jgi:nucleotide-binding universal stress UspA family protein
VTAAAGGVIVVGVDGSDGSRDALTWAAWQADLTGASLRAVGTWRWPNYVTRVPPGVDLAGETATVVAEQVTPITRRHPELAVEQRVIEGPPGPALASLARDAVLLVVGASGRAAFPGMLLGSVADYCVRHAECPVVVVRTGTAVAAHTATPAAAELSSPT